MRKTIILGSLIALLGLGSVALASDRSDRNDSGTAQVTRQASNDDGDRHRRSGARRSRDDRQHESREHGRRSSGNHDAHERRERR